MNKSWKIASATLADSTHGSQTYQAAGMARHSMVYAVGVQLTRPVARPRALAAACPRYRPRVTGGDRR